MPGGHSGWRCRAGKGLCGVLPWRPKQRPPTGEQCGGAITRPLLSVFRVTRPRSIEKDVPSGCASESETMGTLDEDGVALLSPHSKIGWKITWRFAINLTNVKSPIRWPGIEADLLQSRS